MPRRDPQPVRILASQSVVRQQEIGVQRGTGFDMLVNFRLKSFLLAVRNND